ncbi:MAG TPA: carbohydrate-binding protein [Anaerolineae bacterium]|nr:carbohydrate-binding protein [Anaerolineae bacterium]
MMKFRNTHVKWFAALIACTAMIIAIQTPAPAVGQPPPGQVPLDPLTIPKFAQELPIPRTFAPTLIRNAQGQVIRHEYTVSIAHTQVQMLPPGFPATTARAFGGQVKIPGSSQTEFVRSVPGPVFDNTRGIPITLHWRDEIFQPTFMPVDPTLHWANPLNMEPPLPPFAPFPPGYANAQYPVAHVTHIHGLVVKPEFDGTAEEWFTPNAQYRGPSFVSLDYDIPNNQPSTQLFYHDHVMGVTRLGVYAGSVGAAYFIRDPNAPLDQASSPLPKGQFEIPLVFFDRAFYTDGELAFPRESDNPERAYWQAEDEADVSLVNGKVWPNLNVQRRQYRFRMLAADNTRVFNFQFDNNGAFVPFKIIGSDGGYLPTPQVVDEVTLGITERADVLFDFSQFAPGTQIILRNTTPGVNEETTGILMRFTVQGGTAVTPPALPASLFPARPALVANAPARIKTLIRFRDDADTETNRQRSLDGLEFDRPTTEFPLVGSTEDWIIVHTGEEEEIEEGEEPDADLGVHMIHLHLIEFQVLNRQPFDRTAYLQQWSFLNGHRPTTRQIPLDPTPYLTGPVEPPLPYETGWKDTVRTPPEMVTRIRVRWAPQELAVNAVSPGQNRFPFDPTVFPTDSFTGPGYVWHCHLLGHEDHDMMRSQPLVGAWAAGVSYPVGRVIAYQNVNYRVRVAHTSQANQPPPTRFDRWERVNNNNGTWQPQIIYAVGDRALHNGLLYQALLVHQAQTGQTPPNNPALWDALPMTACEQLVEFCADDTDTEVGALAFALGQAGDEAACRGGSADPAEQEAEGLMGFLSVCQHVHPSPCSGLANNPIPFSVADGGNFQSGPLGTGAVAYETTSELLSGTSSSFAAGRQLTVNGRAMPSNGNWPYPLPPQRNHGYCIQITPGNQPWAAFAAW